MSFIRRLRVSTSWRLAERLSRRADSIEALQWAAMKSTRYRADYSIGRTHLATAWDDPREGVVPILRTALDIDDEVDRSKYLEQALSDHAQSMSAIYSRNVREWFGLEDDSPIADWPSSMAMLPWSLVTPEIRAAYPTERSVRRRSRGDERHDGWSGAGSDVYEGPRSTYRAGNYISLIASIRRSGVVEVEPLPDVDLLVKGDRCRWSAGRGGSHRMRLYRALGRPSFDANILNVVDIAQVERWANVANGTYSARDAASIFEAYWDASGLA